MSRHVFVVDDEPDLRELLSEALTADGYTVTTFPDGESLLSGFDDGLPDAILLDINMPGLSGWEVVERLRADPVTAEIPVIAVTARGGSGIERSAQDGLGFANFVRKPFRLDELTATLERSIGDPR